MSLVSTVSRGLAVAVLACGCASGQPAAPVHRIYSTLMNPREHPHDRRRPVRPPDWSTFDNRVQFTSLRGFDVKDGKLNGFREELDKYTRRFALGDVIWPSYPVLFASNLNELADEIRERKLYLFDIWGYVPGSGPGGYWQQFAPPAGVFQMLEAKLGERWLGMDVGEQDGRYIGGYAPQMQPRSADRFGQYMNFHRHFDRMTTDLGSKMATLVSLNFGHYFLKEGIYTLIGAETAQALPNGQVYYSFIRGAGKQYGVPWFGNASVWNRWGWKTYGETGEDRGPTKGTSLSLLKRLMYSHILYNSMLAGFESSWFEGERLSPVGQMQQAAVRWTRQHGQPGVMLTPVALMADHFSGWSFPRHLYSPHVYRVWGNLPYGAGDFLTDGVLDLLYPGYQDSSYFHDERGFLTATPYGDSADALLSDAPQWLLDRYAVLVVAGELSGGAEVGDKLEEYVKGGGKLFISAGNLRRWPNGIGGVSASGGAVRISPGQAIAADGTPIPEPAGYDVLPLRLPAQARVVARVGDVPLVVEVRAGAGEVTVFASTFGVTAENVLGAAVANQVDQPLAKPHPLLNHVRHFLGRAFSGERLFEVGDELAYIVCRRAPGEYTVGITNNSWSPRRFRILSHAGEIEAVKELALDQSEKGARGYLPEGVRADLGVSETSVIAGGDVRIFSVRVKERGIAEIVHRVPPPRPRNRWLTLRDVRMLQEEILRRPEFFDHFDGVVVDWRYLSQRETAALEREGRWARQQQLRVAVDLSSGLNLYPDLRLIDNLEADYAASLRQIEALIAKMEKLGARDLVLSLHRYPENNFSREQTRESLERTLRRVAEMAGARGIAVYLRPAPGKPPELADELVELAARTGAPNLHVANSTALQKSDRRRARMWFVSTTRADVGGATWDWNAPLAGSGNESAVVALLQSAGDVPLVLDGLYQGPDAEYRDIRLLETSLR